MRVIIIIMKEMSTWLLKATCKSWPWLPSLKVGQLCLLWKCLAKDETLTRKTKMMIMVIMVVMMLMITDDADDHC